MTNGHDATLPDFEISVENFDKYHGGFARCGNVRYRILIDRDLGVWTVSDETRDPYDYALHGGRVTVRTNCFRVLGDALQAIERSHVAHFKRTGRTK